MTSRACLLLLGCLALPSPAAADDARVCTDLAAAPAARIAACSRLIDSAGLDNAGRAEALSFRGAAAAELGWHEAAIQDYEAAMRLEPRFAEACGSLTGLLATSRLALMAGKGS